MSAITLEVSIPLAKPLPSAANLREHWSVRMRRVKAVRQLTRMALLTRLPKVVALRAAVDDGASITCTLTRISPRTLDSDNLQASMKNVRDEVAAVVELDDGSPRWSWKYAQTTGKPGMRITIEVAP